MRLFRDLVRVLLSRKPCSEEPQSFVFYINTEDQAEKHVKDKKGCFLCNSIPENLFNIFFKKIKNKKILFIGISYKPQTSYYEKSQSIILLNKVSKNNVVSVFDYNPITIKLDSKIKIKKNITNAIKANDIIVLCHLDKRYKKLNLKDKKVIDFWKQL